jgi:two-component system, LytTR family, response regulator
MTDVVMMPATAQEPPLRALVVDDEPVARQRMTRLLGALPNVQVVGVAGSGREALQRIAECQPEVVFLDIAMPGIDGLELARRAGASADGGPLVVFVTAYDAHALEAFQVHAADYVLKPVSRARLHDALEHARAQVRRRRLERAVTGESAPVSGVTGIDSPNAHLVRLTLRDGHRVIHVPVPEVAWIESFGNYARVYTTATCHIHRATMTTIADEMATHGFVRIHRQVIVNVARVREMRPKGGGHCQVVLDTGARLPVSRTYRPALERALGSRRAT